MIKLIGGRLASALVGISVLAIGSSASAQDNPTAYPKLNISAAVKALDVNPSATPLGNAATTLASTLARPVVAATTAIASTTGAIFQQQPAQTVTVQLTPSIAHEAAWLYNGGWPLYALVNKFATNAPLDEQTNCLATAVYFEARGESVEGQLAVARVVINRAASGRYPPDWCSVVKQPAQFSFVRHGAFPLADTEFGRVAQGRGHRRAGRCEHRPERRFERALVPCGLCEPVVGSPAATSSRRSARTSSMAPDRINRGG